MYTERTTAAAAAARDGTARDMTARSDAACREMDGSLPGGCGNMVFPYIAMQRENAQRYDNREALLQGTLFPGLDLPFRKELRSPLSPGERGAAGADGLGLCHRRAGAVSHHPSQ